MATAKRRYYYEVTAVSSRLVEPHQVRKFQAATVPEPDETLFGFFFRSLSHTAVRRPLVGAALAGIDISSKGLMQSLLDDGNCVHQLAKLLDVDPGEIDARLNRDETLTGGKAALRALATPVRHSLFTSAKRRRVSPLALRVSPHFRQAWEIAPLTFDPQTFEMLLGHCPKCGNELGWLNAQGIHKCDRCKDERGLPSVDLRDFPQPLVDEEYREALGLVASLVDPIAERASKHRELLAKRWLEVPPGDIFDAIVDIACCFVSARTDYRLANGPTVVSKVTPRVLAAATTAFMSDDGFDRLAEFFKLGESERPNDRGKIKRFGPFHNLATPTMKAHPEVRIAVDSAMNRLGRRRKDAEHSGFAGWLNLHQAGEKYGLDYRKVKTFAREGNVEVQQPAQLPPRTSLIREVDISNAAQVAKATVTLCQLGQELGLSQNAIRMLEGPGLFRPVDRPGVSLSGNGPYYSRADVSMVLDWLTDADEVAALPPGYATIRSMLPPDRTAPLYWAGTFLALSSGLLIARRLKDGTGDWRDMVVEREEFLKFCAVAQSRIVASFQEEALVSVAMACDLLGVTQVMIGGLVASGILRRNDTGHIQLRIAELKAFARQFVTSGQIANEFKVPLRRVLPLLHSKGVRALPYGGRTAIFRRNEVERAFGRPIPTALSVQPEWHAEDEEHRMRKR